jgi:hypothetical protein
MDATTIDLVLKVANFTVIFIFGLIGIVISLINLSKNKK